MTGAKQWLTPEQDSISLTGYHPTGLRLKEQNWRFETGSINSLWHSDEISHVQGLTREGL